MGNVRSLANEMDEIVGLVRTQWVYCESSLLCFKETWLHEDIPDSNATVDGFQTVRADRSHLESGKRKGGGLANLFNNKWCHPGHYCLGACMQPGHWTACRESAAILSAEGVLTLDHPGCLHSSDCKCGTREWRHPHHRCGYRHPDTFIAISGDFNHITLAATLPMFKQFVDCPTRENKTLDLLYANVKEAYSSTAFPPLGRSDHNLIQLQPLYKPQVQRLPVTTRTVRRWSRETDEALQGCFELTDSDGNSSSFERAGSYGSAH